MDIGKAVGIDYSIKRNMPRQVFTIGEKYTRYPAPYKAEFEVHGSFEMEDYANARGFVNLLTDPEVGQVTILEINQNGNLLRLPIMATAITLESKRYLQITFYSTLPNDYHMKNHVEELEHFDEIEDLVG